MIPNNNLYNLQVDEVKQPSKTYRINAVTNSISGFVDGLEAVKQSVDLIMSTERYVHPVFSWVYGIELESLVGKDYSYVLAEIKRRIKEALVQDDRITDVANFKFTRKDDGLLVEADVVSDYGKFDIKTVVNV